jgi:transcription-repair coupling factor (superfamily II helicase)
VATRRPPSFQAKLGDLCRELALRRGRGEDVVVLLSSHGTRQRIAEVLEDYGVMAAPGEGRIVLELGSLAGGFELPELGLAVLTEQEVLGAVLVKGRKGERGPRDARAAKGTPFRDLADFQDLVPGDFVVHVDNGAATRGS